MATLIISFRIANDADYQNRWNSTVEAINREATDGVWDETTSFVVLKSLRSADEVAYSIYIGSKFNITKDTLLVINSSNNTYATKGVVNYPNALASMFSSGTQNVLAGNGLGGLLRR